MTSLLLVAAFTAANGEIHLTSTDRAQKKAYYAAQAGIEDYEYHLTQDGNYLSYCTSLAERKQSTEPESAPTARQGPTVPPGPSGESSNEQRYAIQLLPAESDKLAEDHKCDPNHLVETMVEEEGSATGTFRIESTGYSEGEERTIVATFRNANFVSYVWYTKYETADPSTYGPPPPTELERYIKCGQFYGTRPGYCTNNYFGSGESVNGPLHTADHAGICGAVTFGRNSNDRIEFGTEIRRRPRLLQRGMRCSRTYIQRHSHTAGRSPSIEPPPGDEELEHIVEPAYHYFGKTEIILNETTMTVIEHKGAGATGNPETEEKTKLVSRFPQRRDLRLRRKNRDLRSVLTVWSCPQRTPGTPHVAMCTCMANTSSR